jgi:intracellular sulfur oxidation DsrE/DsrF family protein
VRILIINSNSMGRADTELGLRLVGSFLRKLWAREEKPDAIVFYNSAVKLLARGSTDLEALEGLAEGGVDLLACGTCVSFFGLRDSLAVGRISDMGEIAELVMTADQAVTI